MSSLKQKWATPIHTNYSCDRVSMNNLTALTKRLMKLLNDDLMILMMGSTVLKMFSSSFIFDMSKSLWTPSYEFPRCPHFLKLNTLLIAFTIQCSDTFIYIIVHHIEGAQGRPKIDFLVLCLYSILTGVLVSSYNTKDYVSGNQTQFNSDPTSKHLHFQQTFWSKATYITVTAYSLSN